MAKIIFKVKKGGEVTLEVECATGASCDALTLAYEAALGTPLQKTYKPEYFQIEQEQGAEITNEN